MKKSLLLTLATVGMFIFNGLFAQTFNSNSPAIPFNSIASYPNGIMPTVLPSGGTYGKSQDAADAYTRWYGAYINKCTSSTYGVHFDTPSETVSEGIGYGMLLSVMAGDKTTFDALWATYKANEDGSGLMNWQINGCSGAVGTGGASDADEDAAMALVDASVQWPNATSPYTYKTEATTLLDAIKQYEFDANYQVNDGDQAGQSGSSSQYCRNPSYFAPGYYTEFATFDATNSTFWTSCATAASTLLEGNKNATSGLVSNWCSNTSYSDNNCGSTSYGYGYDACRNPWRMTVDYLWHGSKAVTAATDITTLLTNFVKGSETNMSGGNGISQSSTSPSGTKNGAFSTFALPPMTNPSATSSTNQSSLNTCYTNVVGLGQDTYFNETLRTIVMFVLTGNFWSPTSANVCVPPSVLTATTNGTGTNITVTFNEAVTFGASDYSSFSLLIGGTAKSGAITAIAAGGTSSAIVLTLASGTVAAGNVLTLNYTPGTIKATCTGTTAMKAFTAQAVTNGLAGNNTLLDDMEDNDSINNLTGRWFAYNDASDKAKSTVTPLTSKTQTFTMTAGGPAGSKYYAGINYALNVGSYAYSPFVGMGTWINKDTTKLNDWTGTTGMTFYYKGNASTLNVVTSDVTDYAYYAVAIPASTAAWTTVSVLWTALAKPTWSTQTTTFNLKHIMKLQWQVNGASTADKSTGTVGVDSVVIDGLVPVVSCTAPTVTTAASAVNVCSGSGTNVTVTASGTASTYAWSTGATTAGITVTPTATTTYTVTGTSATGGCTTVASQVITVNPLPTVTLTSSPTSLCSGSSAVLTAAGASTYAWSNSGTGTTQTVVPTVTTTYTVTGTSTYGCVGKATSTTLTVNAIPTVTLNASSNSICNGTSTVLTAAGGTTYTWSSGSSNPQTVSPTGTTTYIVTGTSNGCNGTASTTVTVNAKPTVTLSASTSSICNGASTTLTAAGATTYAWSSGTANPQTVSPTATTTYTVTGTQNSCTGTASTVVTVNTKPTVSVSPASASVCIGASTSFTASGATTYSWSSGAATAGLTISPTAATTYTVTGTSNGCTGTASASVTVNPIPTVSVSLPASSGGNYCVSNTSALAITTTPSTGTISLTGTGVSGTNFTPSVAGAGTYTITFKYTDANNCSNTTTTPVTVYALPTLTPVAAPSSVCIGLGSALSVTGATTYSWSNSINTATQSVSPAATTTYTVTGTDGNGCKNTGLTNVTVYTLPTITATSNPMSMCLGSTSTLTAGGGSTYIWSNSVTTATQSLTPTASGTTTYTVTGTDTHTCKNTATTTLTVNPIPTVSVSVPALSTVTGNYCTSNTTGVAITVSPTAVAPATGAITGTGVSGTTFIPSTAGAGTYTLSYKYTDANSCTNTATTTVTVNPMPTVSWAVNPTLVCSDGSTVTISVTVTPTGGTGTFGTLTGLTAISATSAVLNPVTAGSGIKTLTYTYTDPSGCTTAPANSSINVYKTVAPTAVTLSSLSYPIPSPALAFDVTSQALQNVTWFDSTGTVNEGSGNSYTPVIPHKGTTPDSLKTGTYKYEHTQTINGCKSQPATDVYTVTSCPAKAPTPGADPKPCTAGTLSTQLKATAQGTGTLVWFSTASTGSSTTILGSGTSYTVTTTLPGLYNNNYYVAEYDATNHCFGPTSVVPLTINALPTITTTATPASICTGFSSVLGTTVSTSASGTNTYNWSNSVTTASQTVSPTALTTTTTATYTVTVTDGNTCKNSGSVSVVVNPSPTITATAPTAICKGFTSTLTAAGGSSYVWDNGIGATATTVAAPTVSTTYHVTGTDANGCKNTAVTSVTVNPNPTVSVSPATSSVCPGVSTSLTASGANTYAWSNGNLGTIVTVSPIASTTYTITGTDNNSCTATATATVSMNAGATVTISASPSAICAGGSSILTASGGNTYNWSNGVTTTSQTVSPVSTISYSVTGTTSSGCPGIAVQTITVNPLPTLSIVSSSDTICSGTSATLGVSGAATYSWSNNSSASSQTVSPLATATYTVTGTDANNCIDIGTASIVVNTTPTVAVTPTATSVCPGVSTILSASGATAYTWNTGDLGASETVSPIATTTYTVTGTSNNCSAVATSVVTMNQGATVTIATSSNTICAGASTILTASGGNSYTWSNGASTTSQTVSPFSTTTYTVTGTTTTGCPGIAIQTITVNPLPTIVITQSSKSVCPGSSALLIASGGLSYTWNDASTSDSLSVSPTSLTTYAVTGIDGNSCSSSASGIVGINQLPTITIAASNNSICIGAGTTLTANGASTYVWGNGSVGATLSDSPIITTVYLVTGTDANKCVATASKSITVNTLPTVAIVSSNSTVCSGTAVTLTANGASTFVWDDNAGGAVQTVSPINTTGYSVTGTDANNCSAVASTSITVLQPTASSLTVVIGGSYTFFGQSLSKTGTYTHKLTNTEGCDSIITLNLTINNVSIDTTVSACSSFVLNAITYTSSGNYDIGVSPGDTIYLHLTILNPTSSTVTASACGSYSYHGVSYTTSGSYPVTLTNSASCDSLVTLQLTINQATSSTLNITANNSYTLLGQTYNTSGTYTQHTTNKVGCDSTITLILTINNPSTSQIYKTTCGNDTLNGIVYTTSGTYTQLLKNAKGADSTLTLYLTVNKPSKSSFSQTTCSSYNWNGTTYKASGTYTQSFLNVAGCDSIVTLNLTINQPTSSVITQSAVGSYLILGQLLTTSGNYYFTTTNKAGCDSSITLILTITAPPGTQIKQTVCSSYLFNDTLRTVSGTYIETLKSVAKTDSIVSLILTVNQPSTTSFTKQACSSFIWDGTNYNTSGTYTKTYLNKAGCDSTVTLNLTINTPTKSSLTVSAVGSYTLLGTKYTSSGTFTITTTNKANCDSVITLNLTIVDFTALNDTINVATSDINNSIIGTNPGDYPLSAKTALQSAITDALAVANSTTVTQTDVNSATVALHNAIQTFLSTKIGPVDRSALLTEISVAKADDSTAVVGDIPGNYPRNAVDALSHSIDSAKNVVNNALATSSQVATELANLKNAVATFLNSAVMVDKSPLLAAIKNAATDTVDAQGYIGNHPGDYSVTAYNVLTSTIVAAWVVYNNPIATQSAVDDELDTLNKVINAFVKSVVGQPDKTALNAAITTATNLISSAKAATNNPSTSIPGTYPQADIVELQTDTSTAQDYSLRTVYSQSQVDAETATLNNQIAMFKASVIGQPNKTALIEAIATAQDTINTTANNIGSVAGDYPQAAVNALKQAISYAQAVVSDTLETQAVVKATVASLDSALIVFEGQIIQNANKSQLEVEIKTAKADTVGISVGYNPMQYPPAADSAFASAITAAVAVDKNALLTQPVVDKADLALIAADSTFLNSRNPVASNAALKKKIQDVLDTLTKTGGDVQQLPSPTLPSQYPQAAYNALQTTDSIANVIANNPYSTALQMSNEVTILNNAISTYEASLVPIVDKSKLISTVDSALNVTKVAKLGTAPSNYSPVVADSLASAITVADDVVSNNKATTAQVDAAQAEVLRLLAAFEASKVTGIATVNTQLLTVGPVPTADILYVKSGIAIKQIAIVDMNGKCVVTALTNGKDTTVDLSLLPSGGYILIITLADNSITTKAITK